MAFMPGYIPYNAAKDVYILKPEQIGDDSSRLIHLNQLLDKGLTKEALEFNAAWQQYKADQKYPESKPLQGELKMSAANDSLYTNIARNILKYLSEYSYKECSTPNIVKNMSNAGCEAALKDDYHRTVRDVLNRLATLGSITKDESSDKVHRWQIKTPRSTQWYDQNDPFQGKGMKFGEHKVNKVKKFSLNNPLDPIYQTTFQKSPPDDENVNEDENDAPPADTSELEKRVADLEEAAVEDEKKITALQKELKSIQEQIDSKPKKIEIHIHKHKVVELKGKVVPDNYEKILRLAQCRRNILMVGPAGCGKSHTAKLIAESLDLDFSSISCTAGMSESHFTGRSVPNLTTGKSSFVTTEFLERYEKGGIFLLDELDAADPNLLLVINTALANGYCNLPNRVAKPKAVKHEDFIPIATANTFGKGGNRVYAGRNQLDEATLDRFRIGVVECNYDKNIERHLCPDSELLEKCWEIRERINEGELRRTMSTRFIQDAYIMKSQGKWSDEEIMATYFSGWTTSEREKASLKA